MFEQVVGSSSFPKALETDLEKDLVKDLEADLEKDFPHSKDPERIVKELVHREIVQAVAQGIDQSSGMILEQSHQGLDEILNRETLHRHRNVPEGHQ